MPRTWSPLERGMLGAALGLAAVLLLGVAALLEVPLVSLVELRHTAHADVSATTVGALAGLGAFLAGGGLSCAVGAVLMLRR